MSACPDTPPIESFDAMLRPEPRSCSAVPMPYFGCSSSLLRCALRNPVGPTTALDFARINPAHLNSQGLLGRVKLADRLSSWAGAQASRALSEYVGPGSDDVDADRHHRLEVRIARKCSDNAAARDIDAARRLADDARRVRDAWEQGHLSGRHVFIALERTALSEPELSHTVFEQLNDRLSEFTTAQLGTAITRTMCRQDPQGQARRTRVARRHNVGVAFRPLPDGLGQVIATHRIEDARALVEVIDDRADLLLEHRRGCNDCAEAMPDEIGPARAAAHLSLTLNLGTATQPRGATATESGPVESGPVEPGAQPSEGGGPNASESVNDTSGNPSARSPQNSGRRGVGELQVVIDLTTLLGLEQNPGLAAGHPIPAAIARELAAQCGSMRRIITDPVTGHLLDYGQRRYLPAALKTFIAARDGTCRSPGCAQPAARSQLDHVEPYPAGPSNTQNTHSLCKRDHDSKTAGDFRILEHDSSGRTRWRTRDGQRGVLPARPYLNEPSGPAPAPQLKQGSDSHTISGAACDAPGPPEPYPF